jgi:hypothetical protein
MEDKIKIAAAIAPVIIQDALNKGWDVNNDRHLIVGNINDFTNSLLARLTHMN